MSIQFATPLAALIAVAVLVPLAGVLSVSRRAARVRQALGLPELSRGRRLLPVGGVIAVAALLGTAAAQPSLQSSGAQRVRSDAQAFVVLDTSRSMLASSKRGAASRIDRAKAAAARLEAALHDVPVGIASMTNRVLPQLFPTSERDVFRATLADSVGVDRPPPGATAFTVGRKFRNATSFSSLTAVASRRFFSPAARHRVLIVLSDGETRKFAAIDVAKSLQRVRIRPIFVQFWRQNEQVFTKGRAETHYRPNPAARSVLERFANFTGGEVFDESDVAAAASEAHRLLGSGPTAVQASDAARPHALAPYLAGVAFLPLALLFWRRSR